jgi:Flp pilus assembly protein TadG
MNPLLRRFGKTRRGAIAVIFAICLVPLVLLIALTVDYSFYVQARAQAEMAADAAVTHAVRAASETYAYETGLNGTSAAAQEAAFAEAKDAGSKIGEAWFDATLGTMPRATISGTPIVQVDKNTDGSPGFTATVSFAGTYPPFFSSLFNNQLWHINGGAQAESSYNYVEILMLLDNSPSMLIGATESDIKNLEENTVCVPSTIEGNFGGNPWTAAFYQNVPDIQDYPLEQGHNDEILHYTPGPQTQTTNIYPGTQDGYAPGTCDTNATDNNSGNWTGGNNPNAPCAFACHTTTDPLIYPNTPAETNGVPGPPSNSTLGAYTNDYYGLARKAGITLRLDVLQSAASQVITAMETNEATAGQFSVGVYEFSNDVTPVFPTNSGGLQAEASTDLPSAATAIKNAPVPLEANANLGYTDFPTSVADLISGKEQTTGTTFGYAGSTSPGGGLSPAGTGDTSTVAPQKDIFIVTDGMEDTSSSGNRRLGEMTGYLAEQGSAGPDIAAVCQPLKNLGFTVYVLYIDYEPLSNTFYQTANNIGGKSFADPYVDADYPALANGTPKDFAEATAASESAPPDNNTALTTLTPDETALYACASTPADFIEANSSDEIAADLNTMLQRALTSSIQLTR